MQEVSLSLLKGWSQNPRNISQEGLDKLDAQLSLGQFKPLLVTPEDNHYIVLGGNMRLKALTSRGEESVNVIVIEFVNENDVWYSIIDGKRVTERSFPTKLDAMMEYSLADNDRAGWYDMDLFANIKDELSINWDMYAMDITPPQSIEDLLESIAPESPVAEDEAPEVSQEPPISELGKVYQLGRHRLMCGDATKIEDVERLMNGQKADIVLTDPPYGISIVSKNGGVGGGTEGKYRPVLGDDSIQTAIDAYNLCASLGIPKMVFFGGNYFANALPNSPCWLVWDKQDGKQVTFADCEIAWTNFTSPTRMFTHIWDGFRRDSEQGVSRDHPTQKPIKLMAEIMKDYGAENENVIDLFGGSGSTLIACEQTNRQCFMMELDPKYCDVIRKRYWKLKNGEDTGWIDNTPEVIPQTAP